MRLWMPVAFIALFLFYIVYLAFVKKDVKGRLKTEVYPGFFFIGAWGIFYVLFLR